MAFVILFLVVFITITLGPILLLRRLGSGRRPVFAVLQPLNTTAIIIGSPNTEVVDKDDNPVRVNNDGGQFVRLLHTVEGHKLVSSDPDPMNWYLEPSEEGRDIIFRLFGLQIIWFMRYVKINSVRKTRWGRKDGEKEYSMMAKTDHSLYPDFSGQHDIQMNSVETSKVIAFNLRLNLTLEERFPYRVRMRTADAYAQLTIMVNDEVVNMMGTIDPEKFIGDKDKQSDAKNSLKKQLTDHLVSRKVIKRIEGETGLFIRKASLPDFDFDEKTRALLEAAVQAELQGNAAVTAATLAKNARMQEIEAEARYVQDVILPTAKDDRTVSVHWSQTMREQKALHTLVAGQQAFPMLPLAAGDSSDNSNTKDKAEKPTP